MLYLRLGQWLPGGVWPVLARLVAVVLKLAAHQGRLLRLNTMIVWGPKVSAPRRACQHIYHGHTFHMHTYTLHTHMYDGSSNQQCSACVACQAHVMWEPFVVGAALT